MITIRGNFPDIANITLIMNKSFMLDVMTQRKTSQFAMLPIQKPVLGGKVNWKSNFDKFSY